MSNKRYYTCIKYLDGKITTDIWHCSASTIHNLDGYDLIIPLDRKPRNVDIREGA